MKNILRTSDIFTDCESACDKESFVLPRFKLKAVVNRKRRDLHIAGTFSECYYIVVNSVLLSNPSARYSMGRTSPTVIGVVVIQILHFDVFGC